MPEICAIPTKPLQHNGLRLDGLITPTLKAAGSNPVGHTIMWRKKDISCEKPEYIGLFCYPNGDFSLYQNADVKSPFSLCG